MSKLLPAVVLALFTALSPAIAAFAPNRIVTAVDYVARTFSCRAKPGEPSYTYNTTRKTIIRHGRRRVRFSHLWNKGSFSEIKAGDIITVQYHTVGGDRIADRVAVYPKN
jgi:hypothetical protein